MLNFFEETISLDALLFYYINSTHEPLMTNKIVCKLRHEEKKNKNLHTATVLHTHVSHPRFKVNWLRRKKKWRAFSPSAIPNTSQRKKVRKSKKNQLRLPNKKTLCFFYFSIISCSRWTWTSLQKSIKNKGKRLAKKFVTIRRHFVLE
jgi:hypothetical protein